MNWSREGPEAMRLIRRRWLSPLSLEFPCMHNDSSIFLVFTARCPNIMSFHRLTPFFRSTHVRKHWRHPDHFTSQVPVKSDSFISTPLTLSTSSTDFCESFLIKDNCRSHLLPSIHSYTVSSVSFREGKHHWGQICWLSKFRIEAKSCDLLYRSLHSRYGRPPGFSFLIISHLFSRLLLQWSHFSLYLLC